MTGAARRGRERALWIALGALAVVATFCIAAPAIGGDSSDRPG